MPLPFFNDIQFSKITNNILQVSCGFRSTVYLTETRQLFWSGTAGDIQQQDTPIEFEYQNKIPELFSYENHHIIKINHSWSKSMSILYATIAETAPLKVKINNPNKLKIILNHLTTKWISNDSKVININCLVYPPQIEHLDNYIAEKHTIKIPKTTPITKK